MRLVLLRTDRGRIAPEIRQQRPRGFEEMSDLAERPVGGHLSAAITEFVTTVFARYTGRGPRGARTIIDQDVITVVLRESLTTGEQALAAAGRGPVVENLRREFQEAMGDELKEGVERLTGRTVVAFLSANHVEPDIAVETFVLDGGRTRTMHRV
jgi:uncharacterized protein YbcI